MQDGRHARKGESTNENGSVESGIALVSLDGVASVCILDWEGGFDCDVSTIQLYPGALPGKDAETGDIRPRYKAPAIPNISKACDDNGPG